MTRDLTAQLRTILVLAICGMASFSFPLAQDSERLTRRAGGGSATPHKASVLSARLIEPGTRTVCGDGALLQGEDCDGSDLAGQSCQSLGFSHGTLDCERCRYDRSDCVPFTSVDHPRIFISSEEIAAIKTKLGEEPWASAYADLITAANAALGQQPLSVTDNGGQTDNPHEFATDKPYISDGVYDPNADRHDYDAAMTISSALVDLGLGYAFTGRELYARKALALIKVWALDPGTYMVPDVENFGVNADASNSIEIYISMPGIFYGADLIWNSPRWTDSDRNEFVNWVSSIGNSARGGWNGHNNIMFWDILLSAAAGALLNDNTLLDYSFDTWKEELSDQVDADGKLPGELSRTRSLSYSLFAMDAMIQTAEIARHHGVNLYDYTTQGKNLQLVFDFHAPYVADPASWPYEMIIPHAEDEDLNAFELAYAYWQRPSHRWALLQWGRPIRNRFVLDHATLTHGDRFELLQP